MAAVGPWVYTNCAEEMLGGPGNVTPCEEVSRTEDEEGTWGLEPAYCQEFPHGSDWAGVGPGCSDKYSGRLSKAVGFGAFQAGR